MTAITMTSTKIAPIEVWEQFSAKAGETIAAGQAVFIHTDGTVKLADAVTNTACKGIALTGGPTRTPITVMRKGLLEVGDGVSAMNAAAKVYLNDTAGVIGDAAGTVSVQVGEVFALTGNPVDKVLRVFIS